MTPGLAQRLNSSQDDAPGLARVLSGAKALLDAAAWKEGQPLPCGFDGAVLADLKVAHREHHYDLASLQAELGDALKVALDQRPAKPLHVINAALNLVGGRNLAWQQRRAESFTATAFHCGSSELGYRDARVYGGGIRPTGKRKPDRAISLGTALAISGAAANPNMGYHSSPVLTLLMTLFNVRLGAWLGNPGPAGDGTWFGRFRSFGAPGPRFANRPIIDEEHKLLTLDVDVSPSPDWAVTVKVCAPGVEVSMGAPDGRPF